MEVEKIFQTTLHSSHYVDSEMELGLLGLVASSLPTEPSCWTTMFCSVQLLLSSEVQTFPKPGHFPGVGTKQCPHKSVTIMEWTPESGDSGPSTVWLLQAHGL